MIPVTHVIFDVDGLLLDTETLYSDIMDLICEKYGKKFTWEIKIKQMGKKGHEAAKVIIDELDLPITVEEYLETVHQEQQRTFRNANLMPGAEKLVRHLHKHGIPLALATGSGSAEFELKIDKHRDLFNLFLHEVFSSEDPDVKHGKPAPDCFLVAASRFPNPPTLQHALVFEDAPNGVEGALAAGMQVIWVPDPNMNTALFRDRVNAVYKSLEEFRPEDAGLPPYDS